jgi:hypothetical protein
MIGSITIKKQYWRVASAIGWSVMILVASMIALPAKASYVTSLSNTLSSHATSAAANHTLSFVTRTGAAEGTTIVLTFATAFDTSSISVTDVDVAYDATDLTLAADCTGSEQASVAVASDRITITICSGDGGAIASGSTVAIQIGTNATSQVSGASQITNPSSAGSYAVTIGGSFGDRGALAVPMSSPGGVTVSGTLAAGAGGSSGPPLGGGGDTTAPTISSIVVTDITETSARVTWTTDETADSRVDYGLTATYEIGSETDVALINSHSLTLSGLTAGTTYHFRVRSADLATNEAVSEDFTFATLAGPDVTAPVISDVQVLDRTGTSARIVWATDESATSIVDYGLTNAYELGSESDADLVADHSISLTGLMSETTYHFRVRSADTEGNEAASSDNTFTTLDVTAPIISNFAIVDITETGARVTWTTNEVATSTVAYGLTDGYELGTITDATLVTGHSMSLSGLLPATLYHVEARAIDAAGNTTLGGDETFTTLPDETPPANVSDFAAIEVPPGTAQLTWQNPPEADLAGVRIVRRIGEFPTGPDDGIIVFDAFGVETTNPGLSASTNYRYAAFAYDTSGNFASGALASLSTVSVCGDNLCTTGEGAVSCPADCAAPGASVCGNNICESGESRASCPADCGGSSQIVCGNGICEIGESATSCASDCTAPIASVCGNQICERDETEASCPADCRVIEVPPGTVGGSEALAFRDMRFLVANQQIQLTSTSTTYTVLQGKILWIEIAAESFVREPSSVRFLLGSSAYLLRREDGVYRTAIMTPGAVGTTPATLSVLYPDGLSDRIDATVIVRSWGQVLGDPNGALIPLSGALATLLDSNGVQWAAGAFGQDNPTVTRADGSVAWYAPNGTYRVRARANEYREKTVRVIVNQNIVAPVVTLIPLPPVLDELLSTITGNGSLADKVLATGTFVGKAVDYGYEVVRAEVLDNPVVEEVTENVGAPAVAVLATASAGAAASAVGFANVARFLFTQPLVFFSRRKRKAWGIVYNAITKVPIDLAVVRLVDAATGRLVQTRVTDRNGRYFFITQPGNYRIEIQKRPFIFPSVYLESQKKDVLFLDLYHGESLEVTERDATIAANIPVDPQVKEQLPAAVVRKIVWQKIERAISILSPIIALGAVIIAPSLTTIGLLVFQVAVYGVLVWVVRAPKPKGWGIVYDEASGKPLGRAIVRIFEPIYGKLLEMQVTDTRGRYSFLVGPNKYRLAGEKTGYAASTTDLDLTKQKESTVVREELGLRRGAPAAAEPEQWAVEPEPEFKIEEGPE